MPELPEVETIKIGLQKRIVGSKLTKIQILSDKSFIGNPNLAIGQKVLNLWRRAKILGVELDGNITLLFHLKMTGQLIWKGESGKGKGESFIGGHPTKDMMGELPNVHTRVIFSFADGSSYVLPKAKGKVPRARAKILQSEARSGFLYFNDQRRFGWVKIVDSGPTLEVGRGTVDSMFKKLGPEPLEKGFSWKVLENNLLKHKTQPVKVAIMDQAVVAGVGNIYSSEALFDAKIDPRKKVGQLTDAEFKSLHQGVITALKNGIKHGGSTRAHFVDAEGHKGYFLDYAFVYGRDKHKCKVCGNEIKKIQLGGRGTYFCPHCQR